MYFPFCPYIKPCIQEKTLYDVGDLSRLKGASSHK